MVNLARGVYRQGTFKAVMYNARDTLHLDRRFEADAFIPQKPAHPYLVTPAPKAKTQNACIPTSKTAATRTNT